MKQVSLFFLLVFSLSSSAQNLVTFTGISSLNFPATTVSTGVTSSNLIIGTGITSINATGGCSSQPRLNTAAWPTTQNATHSLAFTVTANTNYTLNITGVSLTQRRTTAGPTDYNIQIGANDNTGTTTTTCQTPTSGSTAITLTEGQSTSITIYYWKPAGGTGGNLDLNNITLLGTASQGPLPVKFGDISVVSKERGNTIVFSTYSEKNNDYFELERSNDGQSFESLSKIQSVGDSDEMKSYQFIDENPLSSINYYRIKQVDLDGQSAYSNIVSTKSKANISITVSNENINIDSDAQVVDVMIMNTSGLLVRKIAQVSAQSIYIGDLVAGIYIINVQANGETYSQKVTKQ